jgi:outer membrane immunogenic protein
MLRKNLYIVFAAFLITSASFGQESHSELGVQFTGFFPSTTSGNNGISESATTTAGFQVNYRYHLSHGLSLEGGYGFDQNTQKYNISSGNFRIPSNNHQLTFALVQALPTFGNHKFNPYVLAGAGAILFNPSSTQSNTFSNAQTQTKAAFVYGAGVNYALAKAISLRFEYRGLLYSTPDYGFGGLSTNSVTHSAQPSVGLSFRF